MHGKGTEKVPNRLGKNNGIPNTHPKTNLEAILIAIAASLYSW